MLLLAYDEHAVPSLLAAGGVEPLALLCSSSDPRHQQQAAKALAALAQYSDSVPSLNAAAGDTAAVQQALRCMVSDTATPQVACRAMQALGDALAGLGSPLAAAPTPPPAQPAAPPPAQPAAPPRVCAAEGCTNSQRLRSCGGCGTVSYCSVACSKAHRREHRAECRRLQKAAVAAVAAPEEAAAEPVQGTAAEAEAEAGST